MKTSALRHFVPTMLISVALLATAACEAEWFAPHHFQCEAWKDVHPADTAHTTFVAASHPDSTNCKRVP